ncbi:MAG: DUF1987 domain-containing protein [Bacteroidales bacterium]|nr:MAG: DUF1987 domain-containing protein [Bacteroidales bacterium]
MDNLLVEATDITPRIEFSKHTNTFKIIGKSLPEDVKNFYNPIIQWFDTYSSQPNPETHLILEFEYFNTSSSKMILILLNKLRDIHRRGFKVLVTWSYPSHDAEIEEAGEELEELLNIPFQFIAKD